MSVPRFDAVEIAGRGLCSGCGLCAAAADGAISMRLNASGFLRPVVAAGRILNDDVQDDLALSCPAMNLTAKPSPDVPVHVLWGPVASARTGHATDAEVRHRGSSGGVISALAIHLLHSGAVDGVAQIAVSPDDPLCNTLQISRNRDDVLRAAGSRYAPAAPLEPLLQAMGSGSDWLSSANPAKWQRLDSTFDAIRGLPLGCRFSSRLCVRVCPACMARMLC